VGILVGDGQLLHPGLEKLLETYYSFSLSPGVRLHGNAMIGEDYDPI